METTTEDGRGPLYCLGCGREFDRLKNGQCDECRREGRKPNHRLVAELQRVREERDRSLDLLAKLVAWADDGMAGDPTADFAALREAYELLKDHGRDVR